jgi:hypothetical protein
MTPTSRESVNPTGSTLFMLTLCRLSAPVVIRQPQSPQLKPFTFFMSRAQQLNGEELLYLHMGYFSTLADAQRWSQVMRKKYPHAVASPTPPALLEAAPPGESLTDTRVLQILDTRRVTPVEDAAVEKGSGEIALLRPDDTDTRRVLKEAVAQGAPVSFAVQLHSSAQPIDLASVPSLAIFRAYTLYLTETRQDGRALHCLRLGFFNDAISAKQVGYFVRSDFASVAAVPVSEQERVRATARVIDASALAKPSAQPIARERTTPSQVAAPKTRPADTSKRKGSLEQTLELLAQSETWNDEESFTETGVRHLKVNFEKQRPRRS